MTVLTANHFWLDAAAGAVVAGVAAVVVLAPARSARRPEPALARIRGGLLSGSKEAA